MCVCAVHYPVLGQVRLELTEGNKISNITSTSTMVRVGGQVHDEQLSLTVPAYPVWGDTKEDSVNFCENVLVIGDEVLHGRGDNVQKHPSI